MPSTRFRQRLKPWMLPIAIVSGILFHNQISAIQWVVPYLIFTMLLITFCRVRPSEFRISKMIWELLAVQLFGSVVVFFALRPLDLPLAQGVMICVLCPTATAAPVVTGMLGGSIPKVATYSIVSNLAVALVSPLLFQWVGSGTTEDFDFFGRFVAIALAVGPLIVLPLLVAFLLYFTAPKIHSAISGVQAVSFYLWAVSLLVVVGRAVSFVLAEPSSAIPEMIMMTVLALLVCIVQFALGRRIGRRSGDPVSAGQGLGQKNTVLAIWICLTYFDSISSVGPAAYILWQNIINSGQLYLKMRRESNNNVA